MADFQLVTNLSNVQSGAKPACDFEFVKRGKKKPNQPLFYQPYLNFFKFLFFPPSYKFHPISTNLEEH